MPHELEQPQIPQLQLSKIKKMFCLQHFTLVQLFPIIFAPIGISLGNEALGWLTTGKLIAK